MIRENPDSQTVIKGQRCSLFLSQIKPGLLFLNTFHTHPVPLSSKKLHETKSTRLKPLIKSCINNELFSGIQLYQLLHVVMSSVQLQYSRHCPTRTTEVERNQIENETMHQRSRIMNSCTIKRSHTMNSSKRSNCSWKRSCCGQKPGTVAPLFPSDYGL